MRWQSEHFNREFSKSHALTQHVSQKHPHLQSSPNQEVSNKQVDNDIWDLQKDYPNYDSLEYSIGEYMERSASLVEHSFMKAEVYQMDNMTQDDASQNTSNVSDIEDHEDISFATELYEIGLEDNKGTSFDKAFQDLCYPQTVEWPNDAYLPYMMFKEVPVKTFQNVEYVFYYRLLIKTIKSLLMIDSINQSLILQYEDKKEVRNGVECRIFREQYHSNWWKQEESDLLLGQHLLSLILYSDVTTLDHIGKSSGHPMFLSLGNIPNHQRNKPESKALIGYLLILKAMDSKTKSLINFEWLKKKSSRNIIIFIPRISIFIVDMVEADKFTNVYQPSCSRRQCAKCLVSRDDLNNTNLTEIITRTLDAMKQVINSGEDKDYSFHPEKNAFWEIRNFNIYEAIVPDRMHTFDLGLFKYMLDYTKELLYEQCRGQLLKLHAWCYHIVPAVEEYRSINSMTTETYETLNKDYIKISYHMSNKKDYMKQILKTKLTEKGAQKKYCKVKEFGKFLQSLSLDELDDFIENNKNNMAHYKLKKSATSINDDNRIELFFSTSLESTNIIRATSSFQGSPMFLNVIVNGGNREEEIKW
ncbi:hypothetical protein C2G38_2205808 [Gigaspora rosea]|uniref:Uncharacterized protein n=1 Tax=Gigaspora rosea TaxID=44941 RepID=A0A397USU9_9GLOM|nr:hypothetical protein C2G38_2205808 [Gigaspora rosea]